MSVFVPYHASIAPISEGHGTNQKPAVGTIEPPHPRFSFVRFSGCQYAPPRIKQTRQVVAVYHVGRGPSPPLALLQGEPGVVDPLLIHEFDGSVGCGAPHLCWDRIDNETRIGFG